MTPVYLTSTYVQEELGKNKGYEYARGKNPTREALERNVAALEGGRHGFAFSSGMGCVDSLMKLFRSGDHIVCGENVYGGTFRLFDKLLQNFGLSFTYVDARDPQRIEDAFTDRTVALFVETPTNPLMRITDLRACADIAKRRKALLVVDNTFASPFFQRPLELGAGIVYHSTTKYLNGHSDVTGGVLSGRRELIDAVAAARRKLGGVMDPQAAYALGRGLKTLPIRIARHNANAMAVAAALEGHSAIERVFYPGLPSHPDHAVAKRQMTGFGGMVCIDVKGGQAAAYRVFDRLQVIKRAASLGGTESLCSLPILTSQWGHTDEQLEAAGVTRGMMRLSIGLEDAEDLIADLKQALS